MPGPIRPSRQGRPGHVHGAVRFALSEALSVSRFLTKSHSMIGALGLTLLVSAFAGGCGSGGPSMGRVSGTVSYKGQPLPKGTISFIATDAVRPNATGDIQNGAYTLQTAEPGDGAVVGEYKVAIIDVDPEAANEEMPGMPIEAPKSAIPAKYQNADRSGLTAKVESGGNTINFDLVD